MPHIEIRGNEMRESLTGSYVVYLIHVRGSKNTIVRRRYNDFVDFHGKLTAKFTHPEMPELPPKHWFWNTHPDTIQTRQGDLEQYLREVALVVQGHNAEEQFFNYFLDVEY